MGELTKVFESGGIISACSFYFGVKCSQVYIALIHGNAGHPIVVISIHTLESAVIILLLSSIDAVLGTSRWTKIASTIIQSVSVSVVNFWKSIQYFFVHVDWLSLAVNYDASRRVDIDPVGGGSPIPLRQPSVINSIHDSGVTFCERNESDRVVKRLDDSVTFHVVFHNLSPKEIVRVWPHFSILPHREILCLS